MTDVVPPGGERPSDDEPWPVRATPSAPIVARLPGVPPAVPNGVDMAPDWRTLSDTAGFVPPGYQAFGGRPVYVISRRDSLGLAGCIAGVAGLAQLLLVWLPMISVLAVALSLSGRRFARLDPVGVLAPVLSTIGLGLGAAGVVAGAGLLLADMQSFLG